jgi:hypothetical protein
MAIGKDPSWEAIVSGRAKQHCPPSNEWDYASGSCMSLGDYKMRAGVTASIRGLADVYGTVAPGPTPPRPFWENPWFISAVTLTVGLMLRGSRR